MKELISVLREDRIVFRLINLSLIFILITFLYILLEYRNLPPLIPLFNQLAWGEKRLSPTWGIFIPPVIVVIILIINSLLSSVIYKKIPLLGRMLSITAFIISLLTFLFIVRTIQLIS